MKNTKRNRKVDFSKAVRGKFYKPNATLHIPVYLEPEVQKGVEKIAKRKGQDIATVVGWIIRKELELLDEMK